MLDHYYAVIMAGGGGTRLWPLSRSKRPKQVLSLFNERSLFQTAVQRLQGIFPMERILVVTVQEQAGALKDQCPEIPEENFLIEPAPKGTASVVGFAAVALIDRDPEAVMSVLTSDHYIGNEDLFRDVLLAAHDIALDGFLVTLGIQPTYPATGFGYIQVGDLIGNFRGMPAYHVIRFKEKPNEPQALSLISQGNHTWNSGMFVWRVEQIMREFHRQMPTLAHSLDQIQDNWKKPGRSENFKKIYHALETETIDYGIMEGAGNVAVVPTSGMVWNDVGSWDALFDVLETDDCGNIFMGGNYVTLDTHRCLIYSEEEQRLIVTIGVEDMVLVDTGDVMMICHKDHAQRVRQIVDQLKQDGNSDLV